MARWTKRNDAAKYSGYGLTKFNQLIKDGLIPAKKEPGKPQAPVTIDLDDVDRFFQNLPDVSKKSPATTD